jgi:peptidoglycan/LPS O-acetylase OafA/YrhL
MRSIVKRDIDIQSVLIATFFAFLLLPWQTKGRPGDLYPVNTPHWSLFFELAINLVYASLVKHLKTCILAVVCLTSFVGLVYTTATNGLSLGDLGAKPPTFMLGFLRVTFPFSLGVLLYRFQCPLQFKRDISPLLCSFLFILLMAPWFPRNWYSEILIVGVLFPLLIIAGIGCSNTEKTRVGLGWLGELSYPLYATHEPLVRLTVNAMQILKWDAHPLIVGLLCFVISIGVALVSYLYWDLPAREWLKRA